MATLSKLWIKPRTRDLQDKPFKSLEMRETNSGRARGLTTAKLGPLTWAKISGQRQPSGVECSDRKRRTTICLNLWPTKTIQIELHCLLIHPSLKKSQKWRTLLIKIIKTLKPRIKITWWRLQRTNSLLLSNLKFPARKKTGNKAIWWKTGKWKLSKTTSVFSSTKLCQ